MGATDDEVPYMHEKMTLEDIQRSSEVQGSQQSPTAGEYLTPCTIEGLGPALAAGVMGYAIGGGALTASLRRISDTSAFYMA